MSHPDAYYENLCDEWYQPQEYEVMEDNSNQYINKLIATSSTTITNVPHVKCVYEKKKTNTDYLSCFTPIICVITYCNGLKHVAAGLAKHR